MKSCPTCAHAIQPMDYRWPIFADRDEQVTKINRICLKCYKHWFGVEGDVREFTRKEWDDYVSGAFAAQGEM